MIRLGGHGIEVSPDDPVAFARAHRDFGYRAAYVPPVEVGDAARLAAIERAFAEADVVLAEIGIWRNLVAPEPEVGRANLDHACPLRGQLHRLLRPRHRLCPGPAQHGARGLRRHRGDRAADP